MLTKQGFLFILITGTGVTGLLFPGCQTDSSQRNNDRVEEIPIDGAFSNADLVRNPVTVASGRGADTQPAIMAFQDSIADFGVVNEGAIVERQFEFVNTGKSPLAVSRAYSTCGCTVPEWPEAPVMPGEKGILKVRFDTRGKAGKQVKPVYITANTLPGTTKVYLQGEVIPEKK